MKNLYIISLLSIVCSCETDDITESNYSHDSTEEACSILNNDSSHDLTLCLFAHGNQIDDPADPD